MVKKDKELLIKDLCERLPYGVICHYTHKFIDTEIGDGEIRSIYVKDCLETDFSGIVINHTETGLGYIKPYLRPMSSMTIEEVAQYNATMRTIEVGHEKTLVLMPTSKTFDWLNSKHFDYRGLIEKGLALKAPEDMYK